MAFCFSFLGSELSPDQLLFYALFTQTHTEKGGAETENERENHDPLGLSKEPIWHSLKGTPSRCSCCLAMKMLKDFSQPPGWRDVPSQHLALARLVVSVHRRKKKAPEAHCSQPS